MRTRILAAALAAAAALFALVPAAQMPAQSVPADQPFEIDCTEYANVAGWVATMRMVDGRLELVLDQVRRYAEAPHGIKAQVLVREARAVYTEAKPPAEARYAAWQRCTAVLGRFGPET